MPGGLDSFLNFVVPLAIFFFFGFMVYKNFKTEIDIFIDWIRRSLAKEDDNPQYQVYSNPYIGGETIVYQ